jgi:hypothetical protein
MKKLFMASAALITFAIAMTLFQISSCKKSTAQNSATYPIQGLWIGTYTVDGQPGLGEQYFSFIIKPDGTMINDTKFSNQQHLAPGTWTLSGSTLSCTFTSVYGIPQNIGITETSTATWDNKGKLTTGIWKNVAPLTGSGTFTLSRVN